MPLACEADDIDDDTGLALAHAAIDLAVRLMKPQTFKSHASRHVFSSSAVIEPFGIAPALLMRKSIGPAAFASFVTLADLPRSSACTVTSTLYFAVSVFLAVA